MLKEDDFLLTIIDVLLAILEVFFNFFDSVVEGEFTLADKLPSADGE